MNIIFYSNVTTPEKSYEELPQLKMHNVSFVKLADRDKLFQIGGADILIVDAMGSADAEIISALPSLKLILSEGVGYQGIDTEFAKSRGIAVCNNKGVNDSAVSEVAVMLMLGCLRSIITGNQAVYDGNQIAVKKASFGVNRELGECTVGLIGFGDIARCTAKYLKALGANVLYTNRTRYEELEDEYGVSFAPLDELLNNSDIVSLHVAVTPKTINMVNAEFLSKMKKSAYLINTSRGDLVDNEALLNALLEGEIAGAGLDVIAPEPVEADNILLDARIRDKLVLTPHIAGITHLTVKRIYQSLWDNTSRLENNQEFRNRVN